MKLPAIFQPADTAAAFREQIAQADAAYSAAQERLTELSASRQELLLGDDDRALARLKEQIEAEVLARDKAAARANHARRQLEAAEERERQAAVDAVFAEGEAAAKAYHALLADYGKHARALAALAGKLEDRAGKVEEINRRLAALNDPRRVPPPDETARPQRPGSMPQLHVPVAAGLRLPDPGDGTAYLWPAGAESATGGAMRPLVLASPPREAA